MGVSVSTRLARMFVSVNQAAQERTAEMVRCCQQQVWFKLTKEYRLFLCLDYEMKNHEYLRIKSCMFHLADTNECERNPCQNGATCVNTDGSYTCKCTQYWQGENCQIGIQFVLYCQEGRYSEICPIRHALEDKRVHSVLDKTDECKIQKKKKKSS
jgi:hypothetical protein